MIERQIHVTKEQVCAWLGLPTTARVSVGIPCGPPDDGPDYVVTVYTDAPVTGAVAADVAWLNVAIDERNKLRADLDEARQEIADERNRADICNAAVETVKARLVATEADLDEAIRLLGGAHCPAALVGYVAQGDWYRDRNALVARHPTPSTPTTTEET